MSKRNGKAPPIGKRECYFCKSTPTKVVDAVFVATGTDTPGEVALVARKHPNARTPVCDWHFQVLMRAIDGETESLKALYKALAKKVKR